MKRYIVSKIDLFDTFIFADIFDEEKYQIITDNEILDNLILMAVKLFKESNPQFKNWEKWLSEADNSGYEIEITRDYVSIFRCSLLLLDPIIEQSLELAIKWHGGNNRKTGSDTDMVHLFQVANILRLEDRSKPDKHLIAAALCHDLLEDTECTEKEILEASGKEVLQIVKACSNDPKLEKKEDWEDKKIKYVDSVKSGGKKSMLVSLADKIANAQSLIELHKEIGDRIWNNFNRGKEKKLWFEKMVYKMLKKNLGEHHLLVEYKDLIQQIEKL